MKSHPSQKLHLRLTRATMYLHKHGELTGYSAPANLKIVCEALCKLHPDLPGSVGKTKEERWKYLVNATDALALDIERHPKKQKKEKIQHQKIEKAKTWKEQKRISDEIFFKSREWRKLRYQALVLHGAICQCCGASRKDGIVIHVDHIKPRSLWPSLELVLDNLQVLCEDCNFGKSNIDVTDWRAM